MYTDKKSILQLAALLKAHGIQKIVICPGSRNIPIIQTLTAIPYFTCYQVSDERSAGFFAMGLSLHGGRPAAVCCTSGTALLNLHPAVAEAYYQQVPMVVISADRPARWIGQMDGQTLPQPGVFGDLVKKSVTLPEVRTAEEENYCNRLINEALLETDHHGRGPVHINVPIDEPLFDTPQTELPEVRVIERYQGLNLYENDYKPLIQRLNAYQRRMALTGQMNLIYLFDKVDARTLCRQFVWFTENISNQTVPGYAIRNFDALLESMSPEAQKKMAPELLITYGGHLISKRMKKFLRNNPPKEHWHVAKDGAVADLFGSLTTVIEMDPFEFLEKIAPLMEKKNTDYPVQWENLSKSVPEPKFAYSQMSAIGSVIGHLPAKCVLHLANSSTVRYAQFFKIPEDTEILSNRGTNGIEGSLSTAIGYSTASERLNFILIGDLSFFYDINGLWNTNYGSNIRILLMNNSGGEIFHTLPGLQMSDRTERYIAGTHHTSARAWVEDRGFEYLSAHDETELAAAITRFTEPSVTAKPMVLEVFTDKTDDIEILNEYYKSIKR